METMQTPTLVCPQRFGTEEMAKPSADELAEGQVLLRSTGGGICGSDLPHFRGINTEYAAGATEGHLAKPGSPMHEVVGEVIASRHPGHHEGDRVVGWSLDYEGMRPYLVVPGDDVQRYADRWQPTEAIVLQPIACVLYAVERIGDVKGKRVAVIGQGPIGMLFSRLLKQAGAAHVTGIDPVDHAEASAAFGSDEFIRTTSQMWAARIPDGERPDVVIEAVGHNTITLNDAIHAVAPAGLVFGYGVPDEDGRTVDYLTMMKKDLTLMTGLTRDKRRMLSLADDLMQSDGDLLNLMVSETYGFDDIQKAFDRANAPQTGRMKVVLAR